MSKAVSRTIKNKMIPGRKKTPAIMAPMIGYSDWWWGKGRGKRGETLVDEKLLNKAIEERVNEELSKFLARQIVKKAVGRAIR